VQLLLRPLGSSAQLKEKELIIFFFTGRRFKKSERKRCEAEGVMRLNTGHVLSYRFIPTPLRHTMMEKIISRSFSLFLSTSTSKEQRTKEMKQKTQDIAVETVLLRINRAHSNDTPSPVPLIPTRNFSRKSRTAEV
jgi:hypothetical protein